MIPKIIHYCWFGKKPLTELAVFCIKSWKKYCPDYKFIEWNEDSFDVNSNSYVKEAYESKKWAFVADYVRLYALYNMGGIYLDTDVELLSPLDKFLDNKGFSGFESNELVQSAVMGAEPNNIFIKVLLDDYVNRHFIIDGKKDYTTNTKEITEICVKNGLVLNNKLQTICDYKFYPSDYFAPKDCQTLEVRLTDNSVSIHHFAGSWGTFKDRLHAKIKKMLGPRGCRLVLKYILRDKKYI